MNTVRKTTLGLAALTLLGLTSAPRAQAQGFSGIYAPANAQTITFGTGGIVFTAPASLTLSDPSGFSGAMAEFTAPASGTVTFDALISGPND